MTDRISPKIKILHVAETIKGGVATYLESIDEVIDFENKYLIPEAQEKDISLQKNKLITFQGYNRTTRTLCLIPKLINILKKENFDLIHLHSSFAGYVFVLCKILLRRTPTSIYCAHGWSFLREVSRFEKLACRVFDSFVGRSVSGIIHISKTEKKSAGFIKNKNQTVIYNPVREAYLKNVNYSSSRGKIKKVFFVGRLDHQKGFDLLYKAFSSPKLNDLHLYVAGDAVLSNASYTSRKNITFLGWQPRDALVSLYENMDLTIVPSRWEGFGFVAIESMSRGTPVLVNNAGSLPEIVSKHGVVRDLSSADLIIKEILSFSTPHTTKAIRNYTLERFSPKQFKESLEDFYKKTLQNK